jgi:hypothetical protein
MTNEQYLIVSYFSAGLLALVLGIVTYLWLRGCFNGITRALPSKPAGTFLRRLLAPGLILPALAGFLAVTFYDCNKKTYRDVVSDRDYLEAKTRELIRAPLRYIVIALFVWGIIVLLALLAAKRQKTGEKG